MSSSEGSYVNDDLRIKYVTRIETSVGQNKSTLSIGIVHLCSKEERGGCRGEVKGGEKGEKGAQIKLSQVKNVDTRLINGLSHVSWYRRNSK